MTGGTDSLKGHLEWLYPNPARPCRCDHGYLPQGRINHINMGKAWMRTTTHPDCVHHGTKAQELYRETGRWPKP